MTGLSRADERRRQKQRRRDNIRMVIAGFCVTAGVLLFVSIKIDGDSSAAAPLSHGHPAGPSSSSTTGVLPSYSPDEVPTSGTSDSATDQPATSPAALPIVATGQGNGTGPAQFNNPDVVTAVTTAATIGVEVIDSYDYRNLDAAIAKGLTVTTGQFQASYRSSMTGAVAATAPGAHTVQRCTVQNVGITSVSNDLKRASVLIFGQLRTTDTSTTNTAPRTTQITLGVTLEQVHNVWLISAVTDFATASGDSQPPGTRALFDAVAAGAQEVVNLLTFSRANFDSDFARALAGLTGPLLAEQQGQRASTLSAMNASHVDYVGEIRCIGIETASDNSITMLVAATSYSVSGGVRSVASLPRIELGVTRINGVWLVNQFRSVASG